LAAAPLADHAACKNETEGRPDWTIRKGKPPGKGSPCGGYSRIEEQTCISKGTKQTAGPRQALPGPGLGSGVVGFDMLSQ
jgi:hypothetical protein